MTDTRTCRYAAFTYTGRMHRQNEDRVLANGRVLAAGHLEGITNHAALFAVFDGIGGETGGERAAAMAAESFAWVDGQITSPFVVSEAFRKADQEICFWQRKDQDFCKMSAVMAGISINKDRFLIFNAGDVRAYRYSPQSGLCQLSTDHTAAQDGRSAGPPDTVTRYLGGGGDRWFPSLYRGTLDKAAETFVLCSDGIYKKMDPDALSAVLAGSGSAQQKCRAIAEQALCNGSADDRSILLLEVDGG